MLRSFLISLSKVAWAQRAITHWPLAWRVASRFIAGDSIADATAAVRVLNERGIYATLDHLGENTLSPADAETAVAEIEAILAAIADQNLDAGLSIKLSQLGLTLDAEVAYNHLLTVLSLAQQQGIFVRVDMEESSVTTVTLNLVERAVQAGYNNLGTVIQSCLYRSEADTRRLASLGIPVRLVKGAYQEPAKVAYADKKDVDRSFDQLVRILMEAEAARSDQSRGRFPPLLAVASHDPTRIRLAQEAARAFGLANSQVEFQMLYGIRRDLQQQLAEAGYPVRVYVPFGTRWYPYFMRRLAERPANVWFFLSSLFRR